MSYFIKFFLILACFFQSDFVVSSSLSTATATSEEESSGFQVKIFDVGQGNCVAVKYNSKSILIDCGSKSLSYTAAYAKAADSKGATTQLNKKAAAKADSKEKSGTDEIAEKLEKSILHSPSTSSLKTRVKGAGITPERAATKVELSSSEDSESDVDKNETRSAYKDKIIKEIRSFLGDTSLSVIITHADEDHYNLIPEVTEGKIVEKVIISGQPEDYLKTKKPALEAFREWIDLNASSILSTQDFYSSHKPDKDKTEEDIEAVLTLSEDHLTQIKILAMNASAGGTRDKNADSIVLKITHNNQSILLPGDATDLTWSHVVGDIRSDYFLISHHGAATHESTSPKILERIEPKAVFISAGRYRGTYFHPDRSVIDMLLATSSLEEDQDLQTFVTYFSDKRHRRFETHSLLFTTLNNGTITIYLGDGKSTTERVKLPTRYSFGTRSFTADKSFAFKEDSISESGNPARFFSTLAKGVLGKDNVCFFRISSEGKAEGVAALEMDLEKTGHSSTRNCEHAFLIKQKSPLNEEIIIYLQEHDSN